MKKANRTELRMLKHIRGLSWDVFRMMVPTEDVEGVKKEYESRGYRVLVGVSYPKKFKA